MLSKSALALDRSPELFDQQGRPDMAAEVRKDGRAADGASR